MDTEDKQVVIALLKDRIYPLDYNRWQADELMEEIIRLIEDEL